MKAMTRKQWEIEREAIAAALPAWADDTDDVPLADLVKSAFAGYHAEMSRLKEQLERSKAALAKSERELLRWRTVYAALIMDGTLAPDPNYKPVKAEHE